MVKPYQQVLKLENIGQFKAHARDGDWRPNNPVVFNLLKKRGYIDKYGQTMIKNKVTIKSAYDSVSRFTQTQYTHYDHKVRRQAVLDISEFLVRLIGLHELATPLEVVQSTDLSKSPGWPFTYLCRTTLEFYDRYLEYCEDVFNEKLLKGEFWSGIGIAGKGELRETKKAVEGKNRTIAAVDKAHVHCHKRLTLNVTDAVIDKPITSKFALGFNPYRGGMNGLAAYLGGKKGIYRGWEFDISKMDASISWLMQEDLEFMDVQQLKATARTVENQKKIAMLRQMLYVTTIIMPDGMVYKKGDNGSAGNDSGQTLTAWDNSREALIRFVYAWYKLVPEHATFDDFCEFVRIIILGDDVTLTIHEEYIERYSGENIAEVLYNDFGVILESPSWEARHWDELGFLCMHFHWLNDTLNYVHVLDPSRVVSSLLQGGKGSFQDCQDPVNYMERLCGIRNASWGDVQVRQMVVEAKEEWDRVNMDLKDDADYRLASRGWLPDSKLERLYSGFESDVLGPADEHKTTSVELELLNIHQRN